MSKNSLVKVLVAAALTSAGIASAGVVAPTKASELVTLRPSSAVPNCPDGSIALAMDQRVNSDGTSSAFSIPAGKVLVLTDADWSTCDGMPSANLLVSAQVLSTTSPFDSVYVARLFATASSNGCGGGNANLSGVAIKSGRTICIRANSSDQQRLHGFLASDR